MSTLSFRERLARSAWRVAPQRALSNVIGWGADARLPGAVRGTMLAAFARQYQIDLSEAEKPLAGYSGLQELFTRRLRPGARPVDGRADTVVATADGTFVEMGTVVGGKLIEAKNAEFLLDDLLGDHSLAQRLEGGAYLVTYLSPKDYHRVHSPVAGSVAQWRYLPGSLFPVNHGSVRREPALFSKNERLVTVLQGAAGLCAVVMVAAVGVGHIVASYDPEVATHDGRFGDGHAHHKDFVPGLPMEKGGEIGIFHLGSTSIVVFEPNRVVLDPLVLERPARMGQAIGHLAPRQP